MHNYATDTQRYAFVAYIGVMATVLAFILDPLVNSAVLPYFVNYLPESVGRTIEEQSFFLTSMTVLGIVFSVYNGFAWRFLSDWSSFEATPNLQGYWIRVPPETSAQEAPESQRKSDGSLEFLENHAQLLIGQTWTEMEAGYVDLDSEYWRTDSATIVTNDAPDPELICTYQKESLSETPADATRGTIRLRYLNRDGPDRLVGYHYTDAAATREKLEFVRRSNPIIPVLVSDVNNTEG